MSNADNQPQHNETTLCFVFGCRCLCVRVLFVHANEVKCSRATKGSNQFHKIVFFCYGIDFRCSPIPHGTPFDRKNDTEKPDLYILIERLMRLMPKLLLELAKTATISIKFSANEKSGLANLMLNWFGMAIAVPLLWLQQCSIGYYVISESEFYQPNAKL